MTVLSVIQTIAGIAAESNVAVGAIFALIRGVRDAWPKCDGEVVLTDLELVEVMRQNFSGNVSRNEELQAEILAGNVPA